MRGGTNNTIYDIHVRSASTGSYDTQDDILTAVLMPLLQGPGRCQSRPAPGSASDAVFSFDRMLPLDFPMRGFK